MLGKLISACVFAFALVSCGGHDGAPINRNVQTTPTPPPPPGIDFDSGGTFSVTDSSSPIFGTKVVIVPGSLGDGSEQVSISFEENMPTPFNADAQAMDAAQASKVLVLTRTGTSDLVFPAQVTMPYDKTVVDADSIPVVLFWDPVTNRYSAVTIEAIDRNAGTVTFKTAHFSKFFVAILKRIANIKGSSQPSVDTGFSSAVDGFFPRNFGAYDSPGGSCLGMANYAGWYFSNKKSSKGAGLYSLYREGDTQKDEDDQNARELISRAYIASSQYWGKQALKNQSAGGEVATGITLVQAMILTKDPQTLLLADDIPIKTFGHAATVFAYNANTLQFSVYDNNFPGETITLDWNPVVGFGNYSKYNGVADNFAFDSYHSTFSPRVFQGLFDGVEDGWSDTKFANISVTQPAAVPNKINLFETSAEDNVVFRANVPRLAGETNSTTARFAHIYLNGLTVAAVVNVDNNGDFGYTIPKLPNASGTDVVILISEDQKNWRRGFRAFKQIRIRVANSFFFQNFGFETGALAPWDSERHLWPSGGTESVTPSDKSAIVTAGFDPIATDLPVVLFGSSATRINNSDPDYHISSVSQKAVVPTASNPVIRFSWAAVLEDPMHSPQDQPYVDVSVVNVTKGIDLYRQRYFSNDPTYSGWQPYLGGQWAAIVWQPVEVLVKDYIGDEIVVRIEAADCALGGHGGYAYLDAEE